MTASIVHRLTGLALALGTLLLAWWVIAAASGKGAYDSFLAAAANPLGRLVLFGLVWSLSFHLLNGLRHLSWDLGHGFNIATAKLTAVLAFVLSLILALVVFWLGYMVRDGGLTL